MKILIIFTLCLLFMISCDKLGDVIYEAPVIESFTITPDVPVFPGDTVTAEVEATNPEKGILTYKWENPDGGQFIPPIDLNSVKWIAPLQGGEYRIRIVVKNDDESRDTKRATVQNLEKPYVKILAPANNENFIVGENIEVNVSAFHDNDLSQVWLLVQDRAVDSLSWNSSNSYNFSFIPDTSYFGSVEIKAMAEVFNQPGNTNLDYVNVYINRVILKSGAY